MNNYTEIDETNLDQELSQFFTTRINYLKNKFLQRNINVYGCHNKEDVHSVISNIVNEKKIKSIGFADSATLHQLEVLNSVKKSDIQIINPFERFPDGKLKVFGLQPEGRLNIPKEEYDLRIEEFDDLKRKALITDLFIIGANAITMNAEIVSIDGSGNRVAGMIFGPKYVIIIVGRNKIVKDVDMALWKIHNYTAPINYIRHNEKHHNRGHSLPCIEKGICANCNHAGRACYNTVIVRGSVKSSSDRTHLIIVNEDLGI